MMYFICKVRDCMIAIFVFLSIFSLLAVTGVTLAVNVVPASTTNQEGIALPIIMYHSVLKDSSKQGQYVVSPQTLENDMKYLKNCGYTAVTMRDLFNYVDGEIPLPEKPVMLTFDDGYYNNYVYAYPLSQKYNMKIIISPIGYFTDLYTEKEEDNANYSHLRWCQIREMMDSGMVEFQNHTYNLHGNNPGKRLGAKKLKGESLEQYTELLENDVSQMQREMTAQTGYTPTTFVYPFGAISDASLPILKELGFQATLTCEEKINYITKDADCLYGLGRYLRPAGMSSEEYFKNILREKQ